MTNTHTLASLGHLVHETRPELGTVATGAVCAASQSAEPLLVPEQCKEVESTIAQRTVESRLRHVCCGANRR